MTNTRKHCSKALVVTAAIFGPFTVPVRAQTSGYLTNGSTITVFNPVTGTIVNTFFSFPTDQLAVSADGTKIYQGNGQLRDFAGLTISDSGTGQLLSTVPLPLTDPFKVLLSPDNTTAYVAAQGGVAVVDLTSAKITAIIGTQGGTSDIALSPDGSTFFVAAHATPGPGFAPESAGVTAKCVGMVVCAFSTNPLTKRSPVLNASARSLSVSADSSTLYITNGSGVVDVVTAATMVVTKRVSVPSGYYAVYLTANPIGSSAVILAEANSNNALAYYVFNTKTNQITGTFPAPDPLGTYTDPPAFSRDGSSYWTVTSCLETVPDCANNSTPFSFIGQAFPSGKITAQLSVIPGHGSMAPPR